MADIASFDDVLRLLESLEGKQVDASDGSRMLTASGLLAQNEEDPEADEAMQRFGIESETAESFLLGNDGRIDLFRSEFVSAEWDETFHWLTITTTRGSIVVRETFWGL